MYTKRNLIVSLSSINCFCKSNKISSRWSTAFYNKNFPKVDHNHTSLALTSLDSALQKDANFYPQTFLKERKYIEKKVVTDTNDKLSDQSDGE